MNCNNRQYGRWKSKYKERGIARVQDCKSAGLQECKIAWAKTRKMIQCSPRSPKLELKLEPPASATTGAYRLWMSALQANPGAQTHTERHALIHTSSQTNQPTQKWNWMRLGRFGLTMCMLSYVTGVVGGRGEDAWPLGSLAPRSNFWQKKKRFWILENISYTSRVGNKCLHFYMCPYVQ